MVNLFGKNACSRKRKTRALPANCWADIERLERREVLTTVNVAFSGGNLFLTGDAGVDDVTIAISSANQVNIVGNAGTTIVGNTSGNFLVTGSINVNFAGGNDVLTVSGGAASTFGGNILINMGDGANTTRFTGTVNNAGRDVSITNGAAAAGTTLVDIDGLTTRSLAVKTGTGAASSTVTIDGVTTSGAVNVVATHLGSNIALIGQTAANVVGGGLTVNQSGGTATYLVALGGTTVGGALSIANGTGGNAGIVTLDTVQGAVSVGTTTTIINGNNALNAITIDGAAVGITLTGALNARNGNATVSNAITLNGLTGSSAILTNGNDTGGANLMSLSAGNAVAFTGNVNATNGTASAGNLTFAGNGAGTFGSDNLTLTNGNASIASSFNFAFLGVGAAVAVDGNVTINNGRATAANLVQFNQLTTTGTGNVNIVNALASSDAVFAGGANASSLAGSLAISNAAVATVRSVTVSNVAVNGLAGIKVNNSGAGADVTTIGGTGAANAVTTVAGVTVNAGTGANLINFQQLTVGTNLTFVSSGATAVDTVSLGNLGALVVTGITTVNTGANADTVSIGTAGAAGSASFTGALNVYLGAGGDTLGVGTVGLATVSGLNPTNFLFDGGTGTDVWTVSALAITGINPLTQAVQNKLLSFEGPNLAIA